MFFIKFGSIIVQLRFEFLICYLYCGQDYFVFNFSRVQLTAIQIALEDALLILNHSEISLRITRYFAYWIARSLEEQLR